MAVRHVCVAAGVLAAAAVGAATADAVEQSGIAVAVIQATEALGDVGNRTLRAEAPVFMGDLIVTGASGEAQVRLLDDTRLVVGPNSRLEIDSFVYRGEGAAQQVSLNVVRGAFRFITGKSGKNAYTIRTPTATIGVRGTEFDFNVEPASGLALALYDGWARICDEQGRRCVDVWGACSVAVAPPRQQARRVRSVAERDDQLETFPYVTSQARLRGEFRVDTSSCGVRRAERPRSGSSPTPVQEAALPPEPDPVLDPEPVGAIPSNPGNSKQVGNAGPSPGGGSFGNPGKGQSQ